MLGSGAVLVPLAVRAQSPKKLPRIGWLSTGPPVPRMIEAFRQGLGELGYVEGTNVILEYRQAESKVERLTALANELVDLKVDLIVAPNSLVAHAVKQATSTIPVIVPVMGDPVGEGLVSSLARPGGNITGLTFLGPELLPKRLALLKEAVPAASRIAALWHPGAYGEATMNDMRERAEAGARSLDVTLQLAAVQVPNEFAQAFSDMVRRRADALLISRARCSSRSCELSRTSPWNIACRQTRWQGSSSSSAASWPMAPASPTCCGAPLSTLTRF